MPPKLFSGRVWRIAGILTTIFFMLSFVYSLLMLVQAVLRGVGVM